jgi:hypothetical protein
VIKAQGDHPLAQMYACPLAVVMKISLANI